MIGANRMIVGLIGVFVLAMLGAALTDPLQDQVDSWESNLTTAGQTAAATVVALIPLLFWVLLSVGIILALVSTFLPGKPGGRGPWAPPPPPRRSLLIHPRERWGTFISLPPLGVAALLAVEWALTLLVLAFISVALDPL